MINENLKEKIINDIFFSYKSIDNPNFHFIFKRQNWYNELIFDVKKIYHNIIDLTDLNYDVSKSIEIKDRQNSKKIYLYLSFVGRYSFLLIGGNVFDNNCSRNNKLAKLLYILRRNNIILLSKEELLSILPLCINFDENLNHPTVLSLLFSSGLKLPC